MFLLQDIHFDNQTSKSNQKSCQYIQMAYWRQKERVEQKCKELLQETENKENKKNQISQRNDQANKNNTNGTR